MAALIDFVPLVAQHCPNAPTVSIEFWARHAAKEFCRRTLAHQMTLASFNSVVGQTQYPVSCGVGLQANKLLACRASGRRLLLTRPADLDREEAQSVNAPVEAAFLLGISGLVLWPAPANVEPILVRVSVEPTATAVSLDDDLFAQYGSAIAFGAASRIAMTPDGRDERLAVAMAAMFEDEIGRAKTAVFFNHARAGSRVTPTWC